MQTGSPTKAVTTFTGGPAPPPTPQEVQRKLSMHSKSPPTPVHKRRGSQSKSISASAPLSGTESDSDISTFTPAATQAPVATEGQQQHPPSAQAHPPVTVLSPPLSVIAERRSPSGEETDDEEDDDWATGGGRSVEDIKALDDEAITKAGYLTKKGERRKTWKRRWFVLRQTQLSYYKSNKEYQLLRLLPIADIHAVTPVSLKRHSHAFGIVTPGRTYSLEASSAKEVDDWVRALNEAKARLKEPGGSPAIASNAAAMGGDVPVSPPSLVSAGLAISPSPRLLAMTPGIDTSLPALSPTQAAHAPNLTSSDSDDNDQLGDGPPTSPISRAGPFSENMASPRVQDASFTAPNKVILQGYLTKCGSKRKHWRKRWFVLTPERLAYAKSHMDIGKAPGRGTKVISMDKILDAIECSVGKHADKLGNAATSSTAPTASNAPMTPALSGAALAPGHPVQAGAVPSSPPAGLTASPDLAFMPQLPHTFKIVTPKRAFLLCAPSEEEEIKWISAVRALIARRKGTSLDETGPPVLATGSTNPVVAIPPTPSAKPGRNSGAPGLGAHNEGGHPSTSQALRAKESGPLKPTVGATPS